MKRMIAFLCTLFMLTPTLCGTAEESDFVNVYLCPFQENNFIGTRVVSLAKDFTGYYLDTINALIIDVTWEREGDTLRVTPVDGSMEPMEYAVLYENGVYSLADAEGSVYSVDFRNVQQAASTEDEPAAEGPYTIDDLLGKYICKDEKQIIYIRPQYGSCFFFESGRIGEDFMTLNGDTVSFPFMGTFTIEPVEDPEFPEGTVKLVCTKTGDVAKGTEFIKVQDIVDETELYGTWVGTNEKENVLIINESGMDFTLIRAKSATSHSQVGGCDDLFFAGDTIYISREMTLTVVVSEGEIELVAANERFVRSTAQ